jgi:micrococcal nuclease
MKLKNKTLFLLIAGFVFLFLLNRLDVWPKQNLSGGNLNQADPAQAKSSPADKVTPPPVNAVIKANYATSAAALMPKNISAQTYLVVKVVDGDTIDVSMNGKTVRLRLIGINTPEVVDPRKPVECFGRQASDNAKKLLTGQQVRIAADPSQDDLDIYGRSLRYVWRADGLFYNLEAIKDGFAYEYTYQLPYLYQEEFKTAQKFAQDNQLGLWAAGGCANFKTGLLPSLPAVSDPAATGGKCLIKGNISTNGEKIYHVPGCQYYDQTVIDESHGEKWFCTEAEAVAAGWRKAKNCP